MSLTTAIRAPRGTQLRCKGWHQEAALRMLHNNLDPEVAENPDELIVYGGTGRAARDWPSFHAIVRALESLANDETLLVQSGSRWAFSAPTPNRRACCSRIPTWWGTGRTGTNSTAWRKWGSRCTGR